MAKVITRKNSWKQSRSWGMTDKGLDRDSDGNVYHMYGAVICPLMGYVRVYQYRQRERGRVSYHCRAAHGGRVFTFSQTRDGRLSHRSMSIWVWRHGLPGLRDQLPRADDMGTKIAMLQSELLADRCVQSVKAMQHVADCYAADRDPKYRTRCKLVSKKTGRVV